LRRRQSQYIRIAARTKRTAASRPAINGLGTALELWVVGEVPEAGVDVAAPGPPDNATDVPELVGVGGTVDAETVDADETVDVETEIADDDKVTDVDGRVGTSGVGETVGTGVVGESSASPGSRTVYMKASTTINWGPGTGMEATTVCKVFSSPTHPHNTDQLPLSGRLLAV